MKFLVTGGAGFIGSHLTEELIKQNHSVFIVDDLSSGYEQNLIVHPKLHFLRSRIQDVEQEYFNELDGDRKSVV